MDVRIPEMDSPRRVHGGNGLLTRLNPTATQRLNNVEPKDTYGDYRIPDALAVLDEYHSTTEFSLIHPALDLTETLSSKRDEDFIVELLRDSLEWLNFFHQSVVARARLWANEIVGGFNDSSYARVTFATRALLELFLYTFAVYRKIQALHETSKKGTPQQAIANQLETRDLLVKQARAARINWDDPFGPDWNTMRQELRQTNVLTLIQKLPDVEREQVERWHAILSDACHPNFGSTLFALDFERLNDDPLTFAFSTSSASLDHLQLVVDLTSAPFCFACVQTVGFLKVIDRVRNHYLEGLKQFGNAT